VVITDNIPNGIEGTWQQPSLERETLAFLHTPLVQQVRQRSHAQSWQPTQCRYNLPLHGTFPPIAVCPWLPDLPFHDMGVLQPLYGGFHHDAASAFFLQRPYRWLSAIAIGGNHEWRPNFAYERFKNYSEQRSTRLEQLGRC